MPRDRRAARATMMGLALGAVLLFGPPARAGGPAGDAARKSAARSLADKAAEAYEAGRYDEAIATFQKADETYHAPTLGVALARAYARSGRLLDAREALQKVIAEKLPASAPDAFRSAQGTARVELGELEPRIASLEVRVTGGAGHQLAVTIDGRPQTAASVGSAVEQNPGPHVVDVTVDGRPLRRVVQLGSGEHGHVDVDLTVRRGSVAPAAVTFALGGAALLAGATTGADALVRAAAIKAHCPGGHCRAGDEQDVSGARVVAGVSTGAFVVAGAAVAAGVALYVVRPGGDAQPRLGLTLGPGSLLLSGRF